MPVRQNAFRGILIQISPQPPLLRRAFLAAAHIRALAVQGNNVPPAQVKTVVALAGLPCAVPEILEIAGRPCGVIFVVSRRRAGTRFMPSPGLVITFAEVSLAAIRISQIAH